MNVQTRILTGLCVMLACGFAAISAAPNQGVEVTSASPNFAARGTRLDIELTGKGFDDSSTVAFYPPGLNEPPSADITVHSVRFIKSSKKLIADITVGGIETLEADFEIEVSSRRGRGRGTTFYVFAKDSGPSCEPWPGCKEDPQDPDGGLFTCEEIYGSSSCKNLTGGDCMVSRGNDNTPGVTFVDNCSTQHTLVVPVDDVAMFGGGFELHLVGRWKGGRAAIVNAGGTARVDGLTIVAHGAGPNSDDPPTVADGTCHGIVGEDPGTGAGSYATVSAAVSLNPHRGTTNLPRMTVANLHISSLDDEGMDSGARFCNAIEYASHDGNVGSAMSPLVVGGMEGNVVDENSYSQFGLFTRYVNTGDGDAHVGISDNTIGYSEIGCAAIKAGPWVEKLSVHDNIVVAPGGRGLLCTDEEGV